MNDATFLRLDLPLVSARRAPLLAAACALALLGGGCFTPSSTSDDTDGAESGAGPGSADDGTPDPDDGSGGQSMSTSASTTAMGEGDGSTSDGSATSTADSADESSSGEGDGSDTSGNAPDTTAPEIVSISPEVGEAGVVADATIAITFSEPMDTSATEAAFSSADLGAVTLSWSEGDTVLTIDPDADLAYAAGTDPATVVANEYELSVGVDATDVAGNPLAMAFQSSFFTLREISTTLASDPALTGAVVGDGSLNTGAGGQAVAGDHSDNLQRKGFFSFALADLPAGIVTVQEATLSAYQYLTLGTPFSAPPAGLGALGIDHVAFDALDIDAFTTNPLDDLGVFSNSPAEGTRTLDVTANVADDVANGRPHSQYRLEFPAATNNNGVTDRTRFQTQSIDLVLLVE